jgi:hypothetical protein
VNIVSNGSGVLTITGLVVSGTVNFAHGSITRISKFTASVTTTPTLFNHGLGAIPDIILITVNGTAGGTFSCIYDVSTLTATQAKLTGSASFAVSCLAIKF